MIVGLVYRFIFLTGPPPEEELAFRRRKVSDHVSYYQKSMGGVPLDGTGAAAVPPRGA